nr:hypothetical protein [Sutcliffiella horikoshii]
MDGQVQYAETLREINAVMNTAAKEYKNHIAAMGNDAKATDKLRAEKKKLEIQMESAQKRTGMLRAQYDAMSKDTKTTTGQLTQMYSKLLDAERAETSLQQSMERVNKGLTEQAQEARDAEDKLDKLKSESQLLEAEQKELTSAFKLQNTELGENASAAQKVELAQKQLESQMKLTDRAVKNLESQLETTKKVYGENSVEVRQLNARLNDAKSTVADFKRNLDKLEDSGKKSKKSLDGVEKGLQAIAGAAPAAVIGGLVDSMRDFNRELARLETNALNAGFNVGAIEEGFRKIAAVTGETDSAVETMANLMATDLNEAQLAKVIDEINGAAIRFSDTLKTEGIADGLQETFATGEAVGPFAELLERSGVELERFNRGLEMAKLVGRDTDYVLRQLSELGLASAYEEYKKMNPELVAHEEALIDQQMALAELAKTLTPLVTDVAEFTTKIIEWANEHPKLTTGIAVTTSAVGALTVAGVVLSTIFTALALGAGALGIGLLPLIGIILAITAVIGGFIAIGVLLYKNWDEIKVVGKATFTYLRDLIADMVSKSVGKAIELKNKFFENLEKIKGFFTGLKEKLKIEIPKPKLPKFTISGGFSLMPPSVPSIGIKWNAKGGIFTQPTIFGAYGGKLQGAGEVPGENEALIPLNEKTLGDIGKGIAATMGGSGGKVDVHVYLDTDEMNTKLAPGMSRKIQQTNKVKARSQGVILV